jgi:membrane-bound metal-dependent hydrolase YbcI (DUF457 family)
MLAFGHIGITLGAALVIDGIARYTKNRKSVEAPDNKPAAVRYRVKLADLVLVAVGSLLPDIIDKPVGHYLFPETFGYNGRIFSHTLLFWIVFLIAGLIIYKRYNSRGLLLAAFGITVHLLLDEMWQSPSTLLWPLLGAHFPQGSKSDFLAAMIREYLHNPAAFIPEIIGFLIILEFILIGIRKRLIIVPAIFTREVGKKTS